MFLIHSVQANVDGKKSILTSITTTMLVFSWTKKKFYLMLMFLKNIVKPYIFKKIKEIITILFVCTKKVKRDFQD